jgi:peptide-methionine (S)-S-oxide reductase
MAKMTELITADKALPGRAEGLTVENKHHYLGTPIQQSWKDYATVIFGLGCFWGAEKLFWNIDGVYTTAVGYAGGFTPNPTYEEVCSGMTGHSEVVLVVYDSTRITLDELLTVFWEAHDPTQGMRQGNDIGTQYRSVIYTSTDQDYQKAVASKEHYQQLLQSNGFPEITTEIAVKDQFYYAESYHQQYLSKNPTGYCDLRGSGVDYN